MNQKSVAKNVYVLHVIET